jgi:hypothetical protein
MITSVAEREQVDPLVRLAPEDAGGAPVSRLRARDVEHRGHGRIDHTAPDADSVLVETEDAGTREDGAELAHSIVSRRAELERDTMTAPGFMSDWALE